ncbi:universal stress protein [Fodinicurvata sp. EGI_FJ10296]|uniref:universal stress protein n=1 Tax=Fodinicurvata sp. EGI_FJ10296 TaxID=3231908 RepID=UPI003454088E
MSFKTILTPVEGYGDQRFIVETALFMAQRYGSYIEGMHIRPEIIGAIGTDAMGATIFAENFSREEWEAVQKARTLFFDVMREHDVPICSTTDQPMEGVHAAWMEEVPSGDMFIGNHGRAFDLLVCGQPSQDGPAPRLRTLEAALLESGRPILLAHDPAPKEFGRRIVIAWNGSTETARALADAKPLLSAADSVHVLVVEEAMVPGPSGRDVQIYLKRNGIDAELVETRRKKGQGPGETMLSETHRLGGDLMIKGAYTQSRLRQMIFGGATSFLIAHADLPMFMAH